MSASQFTPFNPRIKPQKPYDEFPLFAHANGCWAKKIRGKLHYFGPWEDADGALAKYLAEKDDLHAGRKPRPDTGALTVKDLANAFLTARQALVQSGELSPRTWDGYKQATDELVSSLGKTRLVADLGPEDFAALRKRMAKKWGPYRLGNTVQAIRSVFKHAWESGPIDRPIRFGPEFKKPSKKTVRLHRAGRGARLFTPEEVRTLLAAAGGQLKAMLLLGINCGFGNADCGNLPVAALDLDQAIVNYPRPKTGIPRRCPLWPETVAALREALAGRPAAKDPADSNLVFVTKYGQSWAKDDRDSPIAKETRKLLDAVGIGGGRTFYTLRHTFRTVADESRDQPACDHIMGHEVAHMSAVYRERISDERLKTVTDHVRTWLYQTAQEGGSLADES